MNSAFSPIVQLSGNCLQNVNVTAGNSRDFEHRERFLPFEPETHLIPGNLPKDMWYWSFEYYKPGMGFNCCSDHAVSFHYESPNQMYVLDFLIYHLRPYGIVGHAPALPDKLSENSIKFLISYDEPVFNGTVEV